MALGVLMGGMQEKAWAAIIEALAERVKNGPRGELSALANKIGATRGTVSRWLSGDLKGRRIPYDKMVRIMLALDIDPSRYFGPQFSAGAVSAAPPLSVSDFTGGAAVLAESPMLYPQLPDLSDYYQVPWLEARASMGGGSLEVSKKVKSYLSFRRDWLLSKGPIGNMVVVSVQGDSMSPTIPDGSVVLINESIGGAPINGKIYLVCYRDELFIKRLRVKDNRAVAIVSDLDGSEISIKKSEYFNIIGRAIWYGKDL